LAIGIAVGVGGLNLALPALFVVASAIGVVLHVNGINLPGAEIVVAASVVLAGFLLARGRALSVWIWAVLFAVAWGSSWSRAHSRSQPHCSRDAGAAASPNLHRGLRERPSSGLD
jgi:hypothetical protein